MDGGWSMSSGARIGRPTRSNGSSGWPTCQPAPSLRLAGEKKSSYEARWSPDGQWIAFLSNRPPVLTGSKLADSTQVYLIARAGGEARQLTRAENGVTQFEWSPDGRTIAFTTRDGKSPARKLRDSTYGEITVIGGDYEMTGLWLQGVPAPDSASLAEPRRLTQGDSFTVGDFKWSPDGGRIAFTAQRDPDLGSSNTATIYVVTLADRSVTKLVTTPGPNTTPVWSPDGGQIAFGTADGSPNFYYTNQRIAVVPASGGAPRVVTMSFDESASPLAWTADGIYFGALHGAYSHLYRVDPTTAAVSRISQPEGLIAIAILARTTTHLASPTWGPATTRSPRYTSQACAISRRKPSPPWAHR